MSVYIGQRLSIPKNVVLLGLGLTFIYNTDATTMTIKLDK